MNKIKIAAFTMLGFSAVCVVAMGAPPQAHVRVGGWSLRANGQVAQNFQYTGSCPVNLQFGWGVMSTAPTAVSYSFSRSDGGRSSSSQTVEVGANQSKPVYDNWRLGANTPQFRDYRGWVQIDISSPNAVTQKVPFTIHCQ